MTNRTLSSSDLIASLANDDLMMWVDVSDTSDGPTGTNKKMTYSGLKALVGALHPNVTLAGSYDYLTIAGQVITINAIDLAADVTGTLPLDNGGTGGSYTTQTELFEALAANGGEIGGVLTVLGGNIRVDNAQRIQAKDSVGVYQDIFYGNSADRIVFGDTAWISLDLASPNNSAELRLRTGVSAFNQNNNDVNFQVGTLLSDWTLHVDGGLDTVSIGSDASIAKLGVVGTSDEVQAAIRAAPSQSAAKVFVIEDSSGVDKVYVDSSYNLDAVSFSVGGAAGASGSFTTTDGKTVTVTNGLITNIV